MKGINHVEDVKSEVSYSKIILTTIVSSIGFYAIITRL